MTAGQSDIEIKLNLESFLFNEFEITLLGLTSVEAQTFTSFIFFLKTKVSHNN